MRHALGMLPLILPESTCIGDIISYANEKVKTREGRKDRCTFAGSIYFKRMESLGMYTTDINAIKNRIKKLNLNGVFDMKLC